MKIEKGHRVFVINSMDRCGEITCAGTVTGHRDTEYVTVDNKGPYHVAFVFHDTTGNRAAYLGFVKRCKERFNEESREMHSVLNRLRFNGG